MKTYKNIDLRDPMTKKVAILKADIITKIRNSGYSKIFPKRHWLLPVISPVSNKSLAIVGYRDGVIIFDDCNYIELEDCVIEDLLYILKVVTL